MTTMTKATFIALLAAPLLLGAAASDKRAGNNQTVSNQNASPTVSVGNGQPTTQPAAGSPSTEVVGVPAPAAPSNAANFAIDWYSINGGGAIDASSASYKMGASVGQSAAGEATSASYKMGIGFWYGAGGCMCTCHNDPKCDGVTDVLDVVGVINVAFRGLPEQDDVGCPKAREDLDCNGHVDVLDVVKMVNVAFRGNDPATQFCNACA